MNELLTVIAILATVGFVGWTITLVALMKSILPMANALSVLGKLDAHIDTQIRKVVERVDLRNQRKPIAMESKPPEVQPDAGSMLREIFGGEPMEPLLEQPDSNMEIVEP